jgi:hypothetical protein
MVVGLVFIPIVGQLNAIIVDSLGSTVGLLVSAIVLFLIVGSIYVYYNSVNKQYATGGEY